MLSKTEAMALTRKLQKFLREELRKYPVYGHEGADEYASYYDDVYDAIEHDRFHDEKAIEAFAIWRDLADNFDLDYEHGVYAQYSRMANPIFRYLEQMPDRDEN